MTERERLIELIRTSSHELTAGCVGDCGFCADKIADQILADGWMRPPCKVGDVVWFIDTRFNEKCVREGIIVNTKYMSYSIDKTRFFVEAEYKYIDPFYDDGRKTKSAIWGCWKEWWGSWLPVYPTKEEADEALKARDNE